MRRVYAAEPLESRRLLAVSISGLDTGRVFDGLGALSNSSSRLLYDYPEPQRSQILDYMFKPNYGASLQILKVEIGGDTNSTDVAEPSHERSRGVFDFTRGFEWWLMKEAKARNPNIKLSALEWGAPGWFSGGFYSTDNINYITSFLDGAAQQGLNFDYVGGWNESVANPTSAAIRNWFINLKAALQVNHASTKLVAYDDGGTVWRVADDVANYPDFAAAVDILGQHSPGVWRSLYQNYTVTANALNCGKPLWASEQSAESHDVGGPSWARGIVRAYEQADITASLAW
jgi:O-glycosyl hydrolase